MKKVHIALIIFFVLVKIALLIGIGEKQKRINQLEDEFMSVKFCVARTDLMPDTVIDIGRDFKTIDGPKSLVGAGYVLAEDMKKLDKLLVKIKITQGKLIDLNYFDNE